MLRIFDHIRRPVVEDLKSAEAHIALLNIYPAVGDNVPERFCLCGVFDFQLVDKQSDGYEIAVGQGGGYVVNLSRHIVHTFNKVLDGH